MLKFGMGNSISIAIGINIDITITIGINAGFGGCSLRCRVCVLSDLRFAGFCAVGVCVRRGSTSNV